MFLKVSFLLAVMVLLTSTAPSVPQLEPTANKCQQVLTAAGATEAFDALVAHAIHSMTVYDLKNFDPSATEHNFVPTVNLDLRAEQAILPYAPDIKTKDFDTFLTDGMRVLDLVLMHMNEKHWDIAAFNSLERVVHAFHMREVWAHIKKEFDEIGKTRPPPSDETCECALDVENNGIMRFMRFLAMAIREPGLVYGDPSFSNFNYKGPLKGYSVYAQYTYHFKKADLLKHGEETSMRELMLHDLSEAMPPLTNATAWDYWKGKANPPPEHGRDPALFLYCAVTKAHKNSIVISSRRAISRTSSGNSSLRTITKTKILFEVENWN